MLRVRILLGVLVGVLFVTLAIAAVSGRRRAARYDLLQRLKSARSLEVEELGVPVQSVRVGDTMLVPHRDDAEYDVLQWYYRDYDGPTALYIVNLTTGEVTQSGIPDGRQIHVCGKVLGPDGKLYLATPDVYPPDQAHGMELYVYDPASKRLESRGVIVPGLSGECRPLVVGADGRIYGAGSYKDGRRAGAYQLDPATGQITDYGPIGPSHAPAGCWGQFIGADDDYVYVASGKVPWYLVAHSKHTGDDTVLLETDRVLGDLSIRQRPDGCVAEASHVLGHGDETLEFWLYKGEAIPKTDDKPPWPARTVTDASVPPEPELSTDRLDPDAEGHAALWYRNASEPDAAATEGEPGATPRAPGWRRARFDVDLFPMDLRRLTEMPDGNLLGTADFYLGNFLFRPDTEQSVRLGKIPLSQYCAASAGGQIYLGGYPYAAVYGYAPQRPWTVGHTRPGHPDSGSAPPGSAAGPAPGDPASNPRLLTRLIDATRTSKLYAADVGADGRVYFGGQCMRDADGGGLGWWDPKTEEAGGIWEPFTAYAVHFLAAADAGKYIVASTETVRDDTRDNLVPDQARLFIYSVVKHEIVRTVDPVPGAESTGPIVELRPGLILGAAADSDGGTLFYTVDVHTGEVRSRKRVPCTLGVDLAYGAYDFRKGPDGWIWTYLDDVLVRINPADLSIEVVGKVGPPGKIAFLGTDLYLAGTPSLRRVRGILK